MGKRTTLLGGPRWLVVAMLSLFVLPGIAQQEPTVSQSAAAASSPVKPGNRQPKSLPPLDQATYLRLRLQLVHGFADRPACESDTPSGHAEEVQRALRVFPEIRKDIETFQGAVQQLGLKNVQNFSDDEKLLIYRQYENLTSIHLEPSGRNDVGQDTYALTFVPNHQPHCDPSAESTIKSTWVNVDELGRVTVGALSLPANSISGTGAVSGLPQQTNVPPDFSPPIRMDTIIAPELRYRLLEEFGRVRLCLCGPVCTGDDIRRHIQMFPNIQKDAKTFRLIAEHLGFIGKNIFTDAEKFAVYREYVQLKTVALEPLAEKYKFSAHANGLRIHGVIDALGQITILGREPEKIGSCPVCLAGGSTRIDTPNGTIPVKDLRVGMLVWTLDSKGRKVAVPILKTSAVPVPPEPRMIHLVMKDGRELWASSGHPTIDGHTVGELRQTAIYDSAVVFSSEVVPYEDTNTYDLLPAGDTGFYWANGILLASTLR